MIAKIKRIPVFFKEVQGELKKVSWSSRQELITATFVVLGGAVFLTTYIALIDTVFSKIMQIVLE